jgi:phosphatidylglycerol:prolipoprotein diacylglycerol transferase
MRFMLEFFREPDAQLGYIIGPLTMRQLLSQLMVGAGVILLMKAIKVGQDFQR